MEQVNRDFAPRWGASTLMSMDSSAMVMSEEQNSGNGSGPKVAQSRLAMALVRPRRLNRNSMIFMFADLRRGRSACGNLEKSSNLGQVKC